jgi:hypothetical protein
VSDGRNRDGMIIKRSESMWESAYEKRVQQYNTKKSTAMKIAREDDQMSND